MDRLSTSFFRIILLLSVLLGSWIVDVPKAVAQSTEAQSLSSLQDSLARLGYLMYNEPSEPERLKANFQFVRTLVAALKIPHSYSFAFDSLHMISILNAPDDRFRLFSWHLPLNDGSYLYYGAVQLKTADGSLRMYPLHDRTYQIDSPETTATTGDQWYGAQYYRIVPLNTDYILLGWKGYSPEETHKVIEVLQLDEGGIRLGKRIFTGEGVEQAVRMIYRFNRNVSMYLDYDPAQRWIVFDHLSPSDGAYTGLWEHYGPDMSYDAWELRNGRLILIPDIPLVNPPSPNDDLYNDPEKPGSHPKSGLSIH